MADLRISNLSNILQSYPEIGKALQQLQDSHNNVAQQVNATPVGSTAAPPKIAKLSVTGGAGQIHASIHDPSGSYRGNTYHYEVIPDGGNWETDAYPVSSGPARAFRGAVGDAGKYHVRACSGYNTSGQSPWVYANNIDTSGSTPPAFPKSTGSGTGGGGWGSRPYSGDTPPKRG